MRLSAVELSLSPRRPRCFRRLELCGRLRRGFDRHRPQRRRKIVAVAHHRRACAQPAARYGSRWTGGDPEMTIAEQAHYLGHQDALKPSLTVGRELAVLGGFSWRADADIDEAAHAVGPGCTGRICRPPIFPPGSADGCRSRGWSPSSGRSGCSTSRPARSTPRRRSGLPN